MSDAVQRRVDGGELDDSIACFSKSAISGGSGWKLASRTIVQPE